MSIVDSPTERTTAATDALMAAIALAYARDLLARGGWRARVWGGALLAMAVAGGLGALAHGLRLSERVKAAIWRILYLSAALTVALVATAATADGWGERAGRRTLPLTLLASLAFDNVRERVGRGYIVFVAYEAAAMLYALGVYVRLARGGRLAGAELTAAGVLLTLLAAGVQASSLKVEAFGVPFDHNGLFHLVQSAGLPVLVAGVRAGLDQQTEP